MDLFLLAERYNQLIRQSDKDRFDTGGSKNSTTTHEIIIFKSEAKQKKFKELLSGIQNSISDFVPINSTDICELSKNIVNAQCFVDGNHRTAVLLCYYLHLHYLSTEIKLKPYLLYAAVDFEYLKSMQGAEKSKKAFFSGNAIHVAIYSRAVKSVNSSILKEVRMDSLLQETLKIGCFLGKLSLTVKKPNIPPSLSVQSKLFRQYAGQRPSLTHSSVLVNDAAYMHHLHLMRDVNQTELLNSSYDPRLDCNNPSVFFPANLKTSMKSTPFPQKKMQDVQENSSISAGKTV